MSHEQEVLSKLGKLYTGIEVLKLDVDYIKKAVDEQKLENKSQQEQIDNLRRWRSYLAGMGVTIMAGLSWILSHIFKGTI